MLLTERQHTLLKHTLIIWFLLLPLSMNAQQQEQYFNRFQYHTYNWRVFHTTDFHVYFPLGNDSLASYIAKEYPKAEKLIKHRMGTSVLKAPNIIIYPSVVQSYESNIGLYEQEHFTFPTLLKKSNRMVLAFTGNHDALKDQLYEGIARALWENQMKEEAEDGLTGGKPIKKDRIPSWFSEGAIHFFAHGWTIEAEDKLRNSYQQNQFQNWEASIAYQPRLSGQAFCYFLSERYYPLAVMQLCNQLRTKSLQRGVRLITKKNLPELYKQCNDYYRERFKISDTNAGPADNQTRVQNTVKKGPAFKRHEGILNKILASPNGQNVAYVITTKGRREVHIYDTRDQKDTRLTTYMLPPWIDQHDKDQYPLIYWADNNKLQVTLSQKGKLLNKDYASSGGLLNKETIEGASGIRQILPFDRNTYMMSAWRNAQSDIVKYDLRRQHYTPLTADNYDDGAFDKNGSDKLMFTGTRPEKEPLHKTDTINIRQGLYILNGKQIEPFITDTTTYVRWDDPKFLEDGRLIATTTLTGTKRFALFSNPPNSNAYKLLGEYELIQLLNGGRVSRYVQEGDSITIIQQPLEEWLNINRTDMVSPWLLDYQERGRARAKEDSIINAAKSETPSFLEGILIPKDAKEQSEKRADSIEKALRYDPKKVKPYILQLHSAYFTAKINNDYYINRYQPYLNYQGQFKFPEIGGMVQGGFSDLFENHHFNIAFRLPAGNEGSDFFVRYRNTAKKLDWGLTYFRKVEMLNADSKRNWTDENGDYYPNAGKVKTHYYEASLDYPINYYLSIGLTTALRQDRTIFLATEKYSLKFNDIKSLWWISSPFITYNKLKPTVPFLYKGIKIKAGIDVFKAFTQQEEALIGSNFQLTHFQPLYKYITLETRLKAGYSIGKSRILYNLGGTDNNVAPKVDSDVHFDQEAPYAFQTLVTPFRGHLQNTLYGDQYALFDADVYFPIFQTLIPIETPLESVNLLQFGMFTDIGTAKEGWNKSAKQQGILYSYGLSARTSLAGYPLRLEIAWPGDFNKQPVWYFSLSLK